MGSASIEGVEARFGQGFVCGVTAALISLPFVQQVQSRKIVGFCPLLRQGRYLLNYEFDSNERVNPCQLETISGR